MLVFNAFVHFITDFKVSSSMSQIVWVAWEVNYIKKMILLYYSDDIAIINIYVCLDEWVQNLTDDALHLSLSLSWTTGVQFCIRRVVISFLLLTGVGEWYRVPEIRDPYWWWINITMIK